MTFSTIKTILNCIDCSDAKHKFDENRLNADISLNPSEKLDDLMFLNRNNNTVWHSQLSKPYLTVLIVLMQWAISLEKHKFDENRWFDVIEQK